MSNPVVWFEIPVMDIGRAADFYAKVFGVVFQKMELFGMTMAFFQMEDNAYGAAGALVKAEGYAPSENGVLPYFASVDVTATLDAAKAAGGKVLLPETQIGEYGWIGQILDTEGNRIGIHRAPPM